MLISPRLVTDKRDCNFYHVFDWPDGSDTPDAQWDLRKDVESYLGRVDFANKSVIEVGPASGYITFEMEKRGATVTCIEPPMDLFWDFVPRASGNPEETKRRFGARIGEVRNAFWYAHRVFNSKARMYEASAYELPESLGTFDIGLLATVLLHVCSPVKMIESVARLVVDTMIITDRQSSLPQNDPLCRLMPSVDNTINDTWWEFSPAFFSNYLALLGFGKQTYQEHSALYVRGNIELPMFTIVARR